MKENKSKIFVLNIKQYWSILLVGLIFIFFSIYVLFNESNIIIPMHDNLDIYIDVYKLLREKNLFFQHNIIAPFLGGIDRDFLPSELKIYSLCYVVFRPYIAYHFSYLIRILISIIGFILCNKYTIKGKDINIAIIVGFVYALLPYYPHQAIGFASLPLLFYVCYSSFKKIKLWNVTSLIFCGFFFDFVFHGIFICGYIFLFFIILSIINKRFHYESFISLLCTILSFLITEYRLFGIILYKHIPLHRIEQVGNYSKSIKNLYLSFVEVFRFGHYHSADLHYLIIYILIILAIGYVLVNTFIKNDNKITTIIKSIFTNPFFLIFIFIVFNCVVYALDGNLYFKNFIATFIKNLKGFQFARTLWLNPFLWYFLLMYILSMTHDYNLGGINKIKNSAIILLLLYLIIRLFVYPSAYNEIQCNAFKNKNNLTYNEYYSERLFDVIKSDISYDNNDKCLCLGMHPSIATYNGFYCMDGYFNVMPLETKHKFRQIIAPSLDANGSKYKKYFDDWGNRVYLFCDDVDYQPVRNISDKPVELKFDNVIFKNNGGRYIISRVPIKNADQLGLYLVNEYEDNSSPYKIFLYKN